MRLQKLTVKGFESAADEVVLNYTDKDMIAFVGENGAGKSMLSLWAVIFALYGKTRHRTINDVISTSAGKAYAELEFTMNNNAYRVIRKLPRIGTHEATLEVFNETDNTWDIIENKNPSSTNKAIINEIGMDFDAAKTTFMALQGEYGLFCESKPSERRMILTQLLGLENYEVFHKSADEKLKDATTESLGYQSQLNEMSKLREIVSAGDPEFEDISDEELMEELEELLEADHALQQKEAEVTFRQDNAESILNDANNAKRQFEKNRHERIEFFKQSIDSLKSEGSNGLKRLEDELASIREAKMHKTDIEKAIEKLQGRIASGENAITAKEGELETVKDSGASQKARKENFIAKSAELDEQEASLKASVAHGATCQTCSQPLSDELVEKVLRGIQDEKSVVSATLKTCEQELTRLKQEFGKTSKELKQFKELLNTLRDDLMKKTQNLASLEQVISREQTILSNIEDEKEKESSRTQRLNKLEADLREVEASEVPQDVLVAIAEAEKNLDATLADTSQEEFDYSGRQRIAKIEKERAARENVREKEAAFDNRKLGLERNLDRAEKEVEQFTMLRKAFAPTGIPAMILAGVIPELEADANEYLDKFSQGEMSLNIETERIHKKGTKAEEILITVNAADGTREYHSFSGGQKFRIDLAIRIAMCKVAARRTGSAAIETLFVDEGFGALDDKGTLSTLSALTELSREMSVIAVSHIDGVKESFPDLFEVSLDSGTTMVREIKSSMAA